VGITTGKGMLDNLKKYASSDSQTWLLGIFARCILSANVIEGISVLVSQHLAMATNDFAMGAVTSSSTDLIPAGGSIADSSVYVGNHGCRPGIDWKDISFSRLDERTINPWMHFNSG